MKRKIENKQIKIPLVVPPRSVVELIKTDEKTPLWKNKIGTQYRIGYYSEQDGLETLWLVDDQGNYCETIDRASVSEYFKIIRLSRVRDYFGKHSKPIPTDKASKADKKK